MADGLLSSALGQIDRTKQALAARFGLLASNPEEFARQLAAEQRQRAGVGLIGEPKTAQEMASGAWINSPYGQQAIEAGSGFAGTTIGKITPEYLGKHLEFHFSVEPNLKPNKYFSEQNRTISKSGERGGTGEIYTTRSPQFWDSQFAYEKSGKIPKHVYLVEVKNPTPFDPLGTIGHQSISKPEDVKVLTKLGESKKDELFDAGLFEWLAEKYSKQQFGMKPDWFAVNK